MVWVRLDDHFDEHHKTASISDSAAILFVSSLCYSNRNLTDGFIPTQIGNRQLRGASPEAAHELETAGMWEQAEGGWMIHDFPDFQPSREAVLHNREQTYVRQARYKDRHRNGVTNGVTNAPGNAPVTLRPVPVPGPVPLQTSEEEKTKHKTLGPAVDKTTAWTPALDDIRTFLVEIDAPEVFFKEAYWLRIDQWVGGNDSGVFYFKELKAYLAHQQSKNGNARGRHKDMLAGFRNWLAMAKRWKDKDAERREIQRRQQPLYPKL